MFRRRAFLGQVPLAGSRSKSSLTEGQDIHATGGLIKKRVGFLWFFPDEDTRARIEAGTGKSVPESVEAQVTHCNPTPGIVPALGDFIDPQSGLVCFVKLPEGWNEVWMWGPK